MLILTRKIGERIIIGDEIQVVIVEVKGNQIRVGIDAPSNMKIYREEIYQQILEENKNASAVSSPSFESDLVALSNMYSEAKGGQAKDSEPTAKDRQSAPEVLVKRKRLKTQH